MERAGEGYAFVMAGGAGSRLQPLTAHHCKPGLPFGARHRVVDFVLSNLLNAGVRSIDLLVQYQPATLVQHVERAWSRTGSRAVRIEPAKPGRPYLGTADAVRQNLIAAQTRGARWVAVFGADHVYRMDVGAMADFHLASEADVTIAVLPVPLARARGFGILDVEGGGRVRAFEEKPARAAESRAHPGCALASMGNYIFSTDVLRDALAAAPAATDFGQHVLPALLHTHRVMAYDFQASPRPGERPEGGRGAEADTRYWRDIGTLDAYFEAHMDTLGAHPLFALDDAAWPIGVAGAEPPRSIDARAEITDSQLGARCVVEGALLDHVVVGEGVHVRPQAQIDHAVLMAGARVGAGARLHRVIVDEGNHIPAGEVIGFDALRDRARFPVSAEGVVVVPRGHFAPPRVQAPASRVPNSAMAPMSARVQAMGA